MKKILIPIIAVLITIVILVTMGFMLPFASAANNGFQQGSVKKSGVLPYVIQLDDGTSVRGATPYLTREGEMAEHWLVPISMLALAGVSMEQNETGATLQYDDTIITLSNVENLYILNEMKYLFGVAPEMYEAELYVPFDLFRLFQFSVVTEFVRTDAIRIAPKTENEYEDITREIAAHIVVGDHAAYYNQISPEFRERQTVEGLQDSWDFVTESNGAFKNIHSYTEVFRTVNDGRVVCEAEILLNHAVNAVLVRLQFLDTTGEIFRIHFFPHQNPMPLSVMEEDLVIGADSEFPLGATLSLPKGEGPFPAVVIVHGSGAADRDYSAYRNFKPFRDLAWGLAEQGIAVLRYDKRSFVYPETHENNPELTIMNETVEDVLHATALLKADDRISDVSILGHSLGGSFAAVIDEKGADFASIISFAGTLRQLWDLGPEQAQYYKSIARDQETADESERNYQLLKSFGDLLEMDDETAKTTMLSHMYLYYYKDMMQYDLFAYAQRSTKPFLILQGETDFQVPAAIDFPLWQDALRNNPNAQFILYENVNHVFMESPENNRGTLQEYLERETAVPDYIIDDIAAFLKQ